jgi:Uma2 family endonuclease
MQLLARYGVGEYWVVDPYDETVEVYRLSGTTYELIQCACASDSLRSATLPNLEFAVARVFDEP